jgi:hypothetical protein
MSFPVWGGGGSGTLINCSEWQKINKKRFVM